MPILKKHFSLSPLNDVPVVVDGGGVITGGFSHKDGNPTIKFSIPTQDALLETSTLHLTGQFLVKLANGNVNKPTMGANDDLNNGANLTANTTFNLPNYGGVKCVIDKVVFQSKKSLVELSSAINYPMYEGLIEAYHYNQQDYLHTPLIRGLSSGSNAPKTNRRMVIAGSDAVMPCLSSDNDKNVGQFFSFRINTDLLNSLPLHLGDDHLGGLLITIHLAPDSAVFCRRHRAIDTANQPNANAVAGVNYVLKNLKLEGRYVLPNAQDLSAYPKAIALNSRLNLINDIQSSINSNSFTPQLQFVKSFLNLYLDNDQVNNFGKNQNNARYMVGQKAHTQAKNGIRFPKDFEVLMKPNNEDEIFAGGASQGTVNPSELIHPSYALGDAEVRKHFEKALLGGIEAYHTDIDRFTMDRSLLEDYDATAPNADGVGDNTRAIMVGIGADYTFNMGLNQNFVNQDYNLTTKSGVNSGNAQLPASRNGGAVANPLLQETFVKHIGNLSFSNLVKVI